MHGGYATPQLCSTCCRSQPEAFEKAQREKTEHLEQLAGCKGEIVGDAIRSRQQVAPMDYTGLAQGEWKPGWAMPKARV